MSKSCGDFEEDYEFYTKETYYPEDFSKKQRNPSKLIENTYKYNNKKITFKWDKQQNIYHESEIYENYFITHTYTEDFIAKNNYTIKINDTYLYICGTTINSNDLNIIAHYNSDIKLIGIEGISINQFFEETGIDLTIYINLLKRYKELDEIEFTEEDRNKIW